MPVVVVVPQTTTEQAKALIRQEGAEVVVHGANFHEANQLALSMVGESDAFLHPFDDPLIWEGHASLVDEIARAGMKPDAVVLSVGGGGLMSGIVEGLHRNHWADVPVIAVETAGADSLAQSLKAGYRVKLPAITSIATSLAASQVCEQAFNWTSRHPVHSVVVSDKDAAGGRRYLRVKWMSGAPAGKGRLEVFTYYPANAGDDPMRVSQLLLPSQPDPGKAIACGANQG